MARFTKAKERSPGTGEDLPSLAADQSKIQNPKSKITAPPGRARVKGDPVKCKKCGQDAFVVRSDAPGKYPAFLTARVRHYRCATCQHTFAI